MSKFQYFLVGAILAPKKKPLKSVEDAQRRQNSFKTG